MNEVTEHPRIESAKWHELTLLKINLVSILAQIVQIGTIAPLMSLTLNKQGVDEVAIGLIVSAPWVAIILIYRFVPMLLNRMGLISANLISIFITTTAFIVMAYVDNLYILFVLNFSVGIGLILRWIACDTWIVSVASQQERGRAIGMHETLMGFGIALGPLLLAATGIEGPLPFFVSAALVGISVFPLLTLRKKNIHPGIPSNKSDLEIFLHIPTAFLGAFIAGFVETSAISFLPLYSLNIGYVVVTATLIAFCYGAGGTILQLPLGWLADRTSYRRAQYFAVSIVFCGALAIPYAMNVSWLIWLVVFLWGGAVGGLNTLAVIEAGERIPVQKITLAMTAIAMCYTLGSIIGPIITGASIKYFSPHGLLLTSAVACIIFALVAIAREVKIAKVVEKIPD